jgi:choline kinase/SAM-dependent methyltransferase
VPDALTVVISAAGMGTRLGMNVPKALVHVDGKPILARQLEMLEDIDDVVVVAGYRSQLIVDLLREVRPNARVALNHEFTSTGTAASVAKGATLATGWVLSLDGDLLVREPDLRAVIEHPGACLGLTPARSKTPVWAHVDSDGIVRDLSQEHNADWEWSGLVKLRHDVARGLGRGHVFHGLMGSLPMASRVIDCVEIDDLDDLRHAELWATSSAAQDGAAAGQTLDHEVIRAFWASKSLEERNRWTSDAMLAHESALLGELVPAPRSILDLGSGHGELSRPLAGDVADLLAVDFAPAYARSFTGPRHTFQAGGLDAFESAAQFHLVLLFGVVTSLDATQEQWLYERMSRWVADDGVAVVKNQCAIGEEFVMTGWSEALGADYSGRYPNVDEQADRLRRAFETVEVLPYPRHLNSWETSVHVAFVCRGRRA